MGVRRLETFCPIWQHSHKAKKNRNIKVKVIVDDSVLVALQTADWHKTKHEVLNGSIAGYLQGIWKKRLISWNFFAQKLSSTWQCKLGTLKARPNCRQELKKAFMFKYYHYRHILEENCFSKSFNFLL